MTDNTDKNGSKDLGAVFDEHVKYEFEDHNVEATMKTMVKEPPTGRYVQIPTVVVMKFENSS
jgi:hypothetical protein